MFKYTKIRRFVLIIILLLIGTLLCLCYLHENFLLRLKHITIFTTNFTYVANGANKTCFNSNEVVNFTQPVLIASICQGDEGNDMSLQIDHLITLIKSVAVLSTSSVSFIITIDKDIIFNKIVEEVKKWPEEISNKLRLQKRYVRFPKPVYKNLFKPCATARLFFAEYMTDIDAAIYVDTDMVFMRPPEKLWKEFQCFQPEQMCGIVGLDGYPHNSKFPIYGESGLNSGLIMMNMTRMRNFPGGWENACHKVYDQYKKYIKLHDQDILNIIFSKNPKYLYEVDCQWNFRSIYCRRGKNRCKAAVGKGVHLLHGCGSKFTSNVDIKLKIVYNAWKDFDPAQPLTELLDSLNSSLLNTEIKDKGKYCTNVKQINEILIKGFNDYIIGFN